MQRFSHSKKTEDEAAPNSKSRSTKTEPGEKSPCHSPPLLASNIGLRCETLRVSKCLEATCKPEICEVTQPSWHRFFRDRRQEVCWKMSTVYQYHEEKDSFSVDSNKILSPEVLHGQTDWRNLSLGTDCRTPMNSPHPLCSDRPIQGAEPFKSLLGQYLTTM